jgi:predicted  nucleic acid-binding Zn-ribbon protein
MAIVYFKHLIEAQSLEKTIKEHLDGISEQNNRVLHIEKHRAIISNETDQLSSELKEKTTLMSNSEKDLASAESKLVKTNEHIPLARNENEANALQTEVDTLTPKIEELENKILENLEEIEVIEAAINEKKEFLSGSAKSLSLISKEADSEKTKHQKQIDSLEGRVELLMEQAGQNHRTAYTLSCERHKFNNPLSFITGGCCSVCRYTINQMQADEIEKGGINESCPGCGRLLTPLSARN